tara:strand:- start:2637 stop:3323 length:687 start_codon:yes stop_codon:yes gene_type:complete
MNLVHHLETLPENAAKLSIKMGSKRHQLAHVHSFAYIPSEEEIQDAMGDYGYGVDYQFARLVWNDEKGRQVKTFSMSTGLIEDGGETGTIKVLVDGLLEMAAEQRRFLSTLNATLQQRENTLTSVLETLMMSREEVLEERMNAVALDLALQDAEKESEMDWKGRTMETLAGIGQTYMATAAGQITPDILKHAMASNPDIVNDMLNDDDIVSTISQKIVEKTLSKDSAI